MFDPDVNVAFVSFFFFLQAGLLGCEAVLSSMALMQASSMAAPPKKMMAPIGHGPPQREGPDRAPQSHMILPSGMSCPPLVRTPLGNSQCFNFVMGVNHWLHEIENVIMEGFSF